MLDHFACLEVHRSRVHKKVPKNLKTGDHDKRAG